MYPKVKDTKMVGEYPALSKAGGGFVWDEVIEYRVWCHSEKGDDYYYAFEDFETAMECSQEERDAEKPLALILQREYIEEPEPERYIHVKEERITEWPVEFLTRPKRMSNTIPDFISPDAPKNRLDIIRGVEEK